MFQVQDCRVLAVFNNNCNKFKICSSKPNKMLKLIINQFLQFQINIKKKNLIMVINILIMKSIIIKGMKKEINYRKNNKIINKWFKRSKIIRKINKCIKRSNKCIKKKIIIKKDNKCIKVKKME